MNKILLIGNLTCDPEVRGTNTGHTVCSFGLAVNSRRAGQDRTEFFRVSAWDKLGETCKAYLSKGKKAFVAGQLSLSTYSKHDGSTGVNLEVTANEVEFLSPKENSPQSYAPVYSAPQMAPAVMTTVETDDLPF